MAEVGRALHIARNAGGVCDAAALLSRDGAVGDDAREAAGWLFSGQLVAHDITADRSPVGPHGGLRGVDREVMAC